MNMLPVYIATPDRGATETAAAARQKRDSEGPGSSGTNAFAATLASAMHSPAAAPDPKKPDGTSELDARATGVGARGNDDKPAFAAAAEARSAAASTPVDSANADSEALNPDFRARLGRVIGRMHDEFGKDVQLVEGFRTQSRQDFLYDQGRSRPGEVVTWTKSSKHTLGLAADVTIDGSYTDSAGFQQLAQVAAQEGLRTLGPKDPGHIELPSRNGASTWGASVGPASIDDSVSRAIGIALDQGNPGDSSERDTGLSNFNGLLSRVGRSSATSAPPIQMPSMSAGGSGTRSGMFGRSGDGPQSDAGKASASTPVAVVADVASVAQVAQVAHVGAPLAAQPHVVGAGPIIGTGTAAAERVGALLDARDSSPAAPLSQVTLNVDNAAGGSDKITVQLRGGAVDTAISLADPNRADRMTLRVGELQHALEQHGLDATAISVASTGKSTGPGWSPRQGSDQSAHDGNSSLNYRDNRQDADETRQRSRREQHGGRQK
ncbi:MAG: M15 family metallopeptidase [Gemmatimonadota bacterium]|nr:M15 family metallopeptidase [Gemmatimonadota bacterium]